MNPQQQQRRLSNFSTESVFVSSALIADNDEVLLIFMAGKGDDLATPNLPVGLVKVKLSSGNDVFLISRSKNPERVGKGVNAITQIPD
jgi:hypothetical protein